jgi:hypothetical protein
MGCFSPDQPANQSYSDILRQTLQTQVGLQPLLYSSQAQYSPLQTNLTLQNLNQLLFGSPEQSYDVSTYKPAVYQSGKNLTYGKTPKDFTGQVINPPLGKAGSGGGSGGMPYASYLPGLPGSDTITGSTPGDVALGVGTLGLSSLPGLAGLFGGGSSKVKIAGEQYGTEHKTQAAQTGLIELMNQANTAMRAAGVSDISKLGPDAVAALLAANPEAAALLKSLNTQAQTGLDAGANLGVTPQEQDLYQRYVQQASRARFADSGLSASPVAASDEALKQFALGDQLQQQRQQFAGQVLGLNQSYLQNPMLALLTGSGGAASGTQGQSLLPGQLFNPESPEAASIANANQQMAALFADPSTLSKINQVTQTTGNVLGTVGSIAGIAGGI